MHPTVPRRDARRSLTARSHRHQLEQNKAEVVRLQEKVAAAEQGVTNDVEKEKASSKSAAKENEYLRRKSACAVLPRLLTAWTSPLAAPAQLRCALAQTRSLRRPPGWRRRSSSSFRRPYGLTLCECRGDATV
jgi:hypothetical protein